MELDNNSLVSVIIPLYNAQKYIEETIQSIINQTYQNWELLIIDDCSTDNSIEIVNNLIDKDTRINLILSKSNFGGPARPRNIGIDNAKGEYIAFLDADDVWYKDKLKVQLKFLQDNDILFTSSDCTLIDEQSNTMQLSKKSQFFNNRISKKNLCDVIKNNFIITSSVLVHKDIVIKFSEEKNFIAVEDFDMWLRILVKNEDKYKYQDKKLLKYRVVENSASQRTNILRQELKANIVLANFLLDNEKYIWCYFSRLFFHLFRKVLKRYVL